MSLKFTSFQDEICFISDSHFGSENPEKEARKKKYFSKLLKHLAERQIPVIFNGDIFDFLFDYGNLIDPKNMNVLIDIFQLTKKSPFVVYLLGNHDLWGKRLIEEYTGVKCCEKLELYFNDKRFFITHGDDLNKNSIIDKISCFILKNGLSVYLFKKIPSRIGFKIAKIVSRLSRGRSKKLNFTYDRYIKFSINKWNEGFDFVIIGHLHSPFIYREKEKELGIIGDWMKHGTVLYYKKGRLVHNIIL